MKEKKTPATKPAEAVSDAQPKPEQSKEPRKRVLQPSYAPPAVTGVSIEQRVLSLMADYQQWAVADISERLTVTATRIANACCALKQKELIVRVERGVYVKATKTAAKQSKEPTPLAERVPSADEGGLTPLERRAVIERTTNGTTRRAGMEPTAEERVLGALGGGPKKFAELPPLCSLTIRGCSDALSGLVAAKKVESYNGSWQLRAAA